MGQRKNHGERFGRVAYHIVVLLLAQREVEFRVLRVRLLELGLEEDHDAVLEEVVVLDGVRVETLRLVVVQPTQC